MRFEHVRPANPVYPWHARHRHHLIFAVLAVSIASVEARTQSQAPSSCELEPLGTGKVRRIIDGRTIQLEIGQQVRLAAIEVPSLPLPRETGPQVQAALAAKAALQALVAGRVVTLKKLGPDADRYGRVVAHVFLEGKERSVQHHLLAEGHARVAADVGSLACAKELLATESKARAAGLGLWSDPYYAVRRAEDVTRLLAERGRFAVVEGKVLSVRESRGTIFVNFGRRWSEDFTVTILKRHERIFSGAGLELKKLSGRQIRVRGVIEQRRGPWIEVTRPEQIQVVE
jgi:endonuclease YncB( thermonuclease family)